MTLCELVKQYREAHGLSQRQFAVACDLSNGYISMLEKNENPKTGLPVAPSLQALKKLASGMGITLTDLFTRADDIPIDLLAGELGEKASTLETESGRSGIDSELASIILDLSPDKKKEALSYLRYLSERADS